MGNAYEGTSFDDRTYGSAGEWNTALNNPSTKTSDSSGTQTVIGVGQQTFRCTCWGLKPNTLHKAFLLNKDVSSDCAPITTGQANSGYTYGSSLVTNSEGKLVFDFRFIPQNSPYPTKQVLNTNNYVAVIPFGQQTFKVSSSDGSSQAQSFITSKQTT